MSQLARVSNLGALFLFWEGVNYLARLTRIDVSLDLSHPVSEITDVISLVINAHPGQQLSILQAIDQHVGDAMAALEIAQQPVQENKVANNDENAE